MKNKILNPLSMLVIGILLGIMSRLFDMYTNVLCDVFSEFAIWVLFGTLISIYSKSREKYLTILYRNANIILHRCRYNSRSI